MLKEFFWWAILVGTILPIISIGVGFFCLCLRCLSCIDDSWGEERRKSNASINQSMANLRNENDTSNTIIEMEPPAVQEIEPMQNHRVVIPIEDTDIAKISPPSYNEVIKSDSAPPTYLESFGL